MEKYKNDLMKENLLREIGISMEYEESKHYEEYINIIRYARFTSTGIYLLMDLSPANLKDITEHIPKSAMSEHMACRYIDYIAHGVQALHDRNIIHRDIKLENILLSMREPYHPLIADMGNAKQVNEAGETRTEYYGSDEKGPKELEDFYLPPELAQRVCWQTYAGI